MNLIRAGMTRFCFIFIAAPVSALQLYTPQMMKYITEILEEIIAVSIKLSPNGMRLKWFGKIKSAQEENIL